MASQQATSRTLKSIALTALAAFAFAFLFGNLDAAAAQSSCPIAAAADALAVLPTVFLAAALQTLETETCILDSQCLLQGLFQMLVSFWLLLFVIAAALLLRAVWKGKIEVFRAPGKYFRK
jgi:hypothetical protein